MSLWSLQVSPVDDKVTVDYPGVPTSGFKVELIPSVPGKTPEVSNLKTKVCVEPGGNLFSFHYFLFEFRLMRQ